METNTKQIFTTLFAMLVIALATASCGKTEQRAEATDASPKANASSEVSAVPDAIHVYYFHNTRRCATCMGIQAAIEGVVEGQFAKDLEAGMLVFHELNMEEEANKAYVKQFQLSFGSMVVTAQKGDKVLAFENANKVWEYAHTEDKLKAYVTENIQAYLNKLGTAL